MKTIIRSYLFNMVSILFMAWQFVYLFDYQHQFAHMIETEQEPPWEMTLNFLPTFMMLIVVLAYVIYHMTLKKKIKWKQLFFQPVEFLEDDEREKMITAQACRTSYLTLLYTFPFIAALLLVYPFIQPTIPYFPILIIFLIPVMLITAYHVSLMKNI